MGNLINFRRWSKANEYPLLQSWVITNLDRSHAQLQQDLVAEFFFKNSKGYFVEFGATNGIDLSNSYILEKELGWDGLLSEPARSWKHSLLSNRSAHKDFRAVAGVTGEIRNFTEATQGEYSTFTSQSNQGIHQNIRSNSESYDVETVSLFDLLQSANSPKHIQVLSIDTEGSEYEILSTFPLSEYEIDLIFVEHNHTTYEKLIDNLLVENGYKRFLSHISEFDGWYLRNDLAHLLS